MTRHASDCGSNTEPAYPAGPCDCGVAKPAEPPPTEPTVEQCLEEAKREHKVCLRVFPDWIVAGRIKANIADHRLRCQRAIIRRLEEEVAKGRLF